MLLHLLSYAIIVFISGLLHFRPVQMVSSSKRQTTIIVDFYHFSCIYLHPENHYDYIMMAVIWLSASVELDGKQPHIDLARFIPDPLDFSFSLMYNYRKKFIEKNSRLLFFCRWRHWILHLTDFNCIDFIMFHSLLFENNSWYVLRRIFYFYSRFISIFCKS